MVKSTKYLHVWRFPVLNLNEIVCAAYVVACTNKMCSLSFTFLRRLAVLLDKTLRLYCKCIVLPCCVRNIAPKQQLKLRARASAAIVCAPIAAIFKESLYDRIPYFVSVLQFTETHPGHHNAWWIIYTNMLKLWMLGRIMCPEKQSSYGWLQNHWWISFVDWN